MNSLITLNNGYKNILNNDQKSPTSFKAGTDNLVKETDKLINNLPSGEKWLAKFIRMKEGDSGLSHIRFIQDTSTNWVPKAIFTRSLADFADMSFLEYTESALFYYAPAVVGQHLLRPLFKSFIKNDELKEHLASSVTEIEQKLGNSPEAKKVVTLKAAMILACVCIPAAEYALSFAKNLFTLKFFKKADFGNIANLKKGQKEDPKFQQKVKDSAKKHIIKAGLVSLVAIGASAALAIFGHKSDRLVALSKRLLDPGRYLANAFKLPQKDSGWRGALEKYIHLDFSFKKNSEEALLKNDKADKRLLGLSNGQLAASVIAGVVGYLAAAKDRGRLDYLEVLTRVPFIVAPYTIFGSALFDHGFKKLAFNQKWMKDLIKKDKEGKIEPILGFNALLDKAKKMSAEQGGDVQKHWRELFKQKAIISLTPFLFSLLVVGGAVAAMSRFWTQYRYNHGIGRGTPAQSLNNDAFTSLFQVKKTANTKLF